MCLFWVLNGSLGLWKPGPGSLWGPFWVLGFQLYHDGKREGLGLRGRGRTEDFFSGPRADVNGPGQLHICLTVRWSICWSIGPYSRSARSDLCLCYNILVYRNMRLRFAENVYRYVSMYVSRFPRVSQKTWFLSEKSQIINSTFWSLLRNKMFWVILLIFGHYFRLLTLFHCSCPHQTSLSLSKHLLASESHLLW